MKGDNSAALWCVGFGKLPRVKGHARISHMHQVSSAPTSPGPDRPLGRTSTRPTFPLWGLMTVVAVSTWIWFDTLKAALLCPWTWLTGISASQIITIGLAWVSRLPWPWLCSAWGSRFFLKRLDTGHLVCENLGGHLPAVLATTFIPGVGMSPSPCIPGLSWTPTGTSWESMSSILHGHGTCSHFASAATSGS